MRPAPPAMRLAPPGAHAPAAPRALMAAAMAFAVIAASGAAAATLHAQQRPDSAARAANAPYATPALRELVAAAALANRRPPDSLAGYAARVESEMALGLRDTLGVDRTTQLEQLAVDARWHRSGRYDLHVIGYRAQLLGPSLSLLSFLRGWTVPVLYGNRLRLGIVGDTTRRRRSPLPGRRARTMDGDSGVIVVHPFADDRDRFYRFEGGDTVAVLRTKWRDIPVVRVRTRPATGAPTAALLFEGDVDLDATRREVVRMRGKLVRVDPARDYGGVTGAGRVVSGVGFIEFENAEIDGKYWLPAYQRTEMQGFFTPMGDMRSVFRIVSRFRQVTPNDSAVRAVGARPDSGGGDAYRLSRAPGDSVAAYAAWELPLGEANSRVGADDFADLAPAAWSAGGAPVAELRVRSFGEFLHFNRVEGLFTGLGWQLRLRDVAPGVVLRASAGWGWAEGTARGAVAAERLRGRRLWTIRMARSLDGTGDLAVDAGAGSSIAALFYSLDNQDYVDRRSATVALITGAGGNAAGRVRAEIGLVSDRGVRPHLRRGLFGSDTGFRPLRGVDAGDYARGVVQLDLRPRTTGEFLDEGVGGILRLEAARGGLDYQRLDASVVLRHDYGRLLLFGRLSGAMVAGSAPPQQLVELGDQEGLTGYGYRQFTGDRGGLGAIQAHWRFGWLTAPIRLGARFVVPGLAPGVAVGVQGGWTELATTSGRAAAGRLLAPLGVAPRTTGGVRATVDARLTIFGGAVGFGVARPIDGFHDRRGGWRAVFTVGQSLGG